VDPNVVRKDTETTPLFIASHHGHEEAVKEILSHPNTRVNQGKLGTNISPLYQAVQGGHEGVVEAILAVKGVNANQATTEGNTPLGKACELGNEHIVRLLLSAEGINVNGELQGGNTAFSIASQNNHADIVEMLLAHSGMESASKSNETRPTAPSTDQLKPLSETARTFTTNPGVRKVDDLDHRSSQIEIAHTVSSDDKQIAFRGRKGSAFLPAIEGPKIVDVAKGKPRVQKMPGIDRNLESFNQADLTKFRGPSQMR
jgi:ankyrin repeat protein